MAAMKKVKFGEPGSMDGPSDSSEAPSAFHRFQHPADDIFQQPAAAPMQVRMPTIVKIPPSLVFKTEYLFYTDGDWQRRQPLFSSSN